MLDIIQVIKRLVFCFFAFFIVFTSKSQNLKSISYNMENGFSVNITKCIIQDDLGYIWVGTDEGILRFDGNHSILYKNALPSPYIKFLYKLRNGKLMVIHDMGVHEIDSKSDTAYFKSFMRGIDKKTDSTLQFPKSMCETKDGNLWFSGDDGITKYNNGKIKKYKFSEENYTGNYTHGFSFCIDNNQKLWTISSGGKLYYHNSELDLFTEINIGNKIQFATGIIALENNRIVISSNSGLFLVELNNQHEVLQHNKLFNISGISGISKIDSLRNTIFITMYSGILHKAIISPKNISLLSDSISVSNRINNLYYAKEKLWLCTHNGINLIQKRYFTPISFTSSSLYKGDFDYQGLTQAFDSSIYFVNGNAVYKQKKQGGSFKHEFIFSESKLAIGTIVADNKGIWYEIIGGDINYFNFDKQQSEKIFKTSTSRDLINFMFLDKAGNFWVSRQITGLVRIDKEHKLKKYENNIAYNQLLNAYQNSKGKLYFIGRGNSTYLFEYDEPKDTIINISINLPFENNSSFEATDFIICQQGNAWIGTPKGLLKYTMSDTSSQKIETIDLGKYTNESIKALSYTKDGSLWIAIRYGILRYKNKKAYLYNKLSGLISNTIVHRKMFSDFSQKVWASTSKGNCYSKPVDNHPIKQTPPPRIYNLKINGNKILADSLNNITIQTQSNIDFYFSTPIFPSNNILYKINLISTDTLWQIETSNAHLSLPPLKGGDYCLTIKAKQIGNGCEWSKEIIQNFQIETIWYTKWWAYVLYCIILVVTIWGIVQLNTLRLKKEKKYLEKIVDKRTKEIQKKSIELVQEKDLVLKKTLILEKQSNKLKEAWNEISKVNIRLQQKNEEIEAQTEELQATTDAVISHNKKLEKSKIEIELANLKFKTIFEKSSDPHILLDNTIIDCNEATLKLLKCVDKEKLMTMHPIEFSPEKQPDKSFSKKKAIKMRRIALEKGISHFEWMVRDFKKKNILLEVSISPIDYLEKKALLIVCHDITARKKAETELRAAHKEVMTANHEIMFTNIQLERKNDEVLEQKNEIEEKSLSITASINYASRIQTALLPSDETVKELLSDFFILYKPRDIVSGDFYWINRLDKYIIIISADCTGHGVPGAFMSMLGISYLNEIVKSNEMIDNPQADKMLETLRTKVKSAMSQRDKLTERKDGMDVGICIIDANAKKLQFAGANQELFIIRNEELIQYKGNRMPVGIFPRETAFKSTNINIQENDMIYMFSDGYQDQFGGERHRKYGKKAFRELIIASKHKSMHEQKKNLEYTIEKWMGKDEQIDDMLVIGAKLQLSKMKFNINNKKHIWSNKIILVAEDDKLSFTIVEAAIAHTGALVIWARNGIEAVEKYKANHNIDLILMDIQMPLLNGFDAIKKIKEKNNDIPIITLTANFVNTKDDAIEAGCVDHIKKPIRPKELLTIIGNYI